MLAPPRQRAEVPDGDAHARGLLLHEAARSRSTNLIHLKIDYSSILNLDIFAVLSTDLKYRIDLWHTMRCSCCLRRDLIANCIRAKHSSHALST